MALRIPQTLTAFLFTVFTVWAVSAQDESPGTESTPKTLSCDYGSGTEVSTCSFEVNEEMSHPNMRWKVGTGITAFWLGGPLKDRSTMENTGGYLYLDTSYKQMNKVFSTAALESGEQSSLFVGQMDRPKDSVTLTFPLQSTEATPFKSALFQASRMSANLTGRTRDRASTQQYERRFIAEVLNASSPAPGVSSDSSTILRLQGKSQNVSAAYLNEPLLAARDSPGLLLPSSEAVQNSGSMLSPNISATGPMGNCVRFYYNMDGLSADRLRISVLDYITGVNQTLWETSRQTDGEWVKVEVAYAYESYHKIVLEGIAKDINSPERAYRGYVAIDDFSYSFLDEESAGMCHGHCTFEGGLCGWTNVPEGDDFDWSQGRGSDNFYTGPSRDFHSFSREFPLGGYLYIDASYPRRPGDRALLRSPQFPAPTVGERNTEQEQKENYGPICLKFAAHMFGNGIGTLRVKVRPAEEGGEGSEVTKERVLWEMSGEAGNRWQLAQLSYAATTAYHFIFEGVIGPNYLGNIAIDSILIEQGACPISPQTASRKSGDCTFEESECAWTNPRSTLQLDQFDWVRQFGHGSYGPRTDHTVGGLLGHYMSLNGDNTLQRGGSWAWLISPEFHMEGVRGNTEPGAQPPLAKCLSFYYYMYQRAIEPGGPSLGALPNNAETVQGECSFDRTLCGWRNDTLNVNGKAVNTDSNGQLNGLRSPQLSLVSHKISHTSGGVAGLVGTSSLSSHHPSSSLIAGGDRSLSWGPNKPLISWKLATLNSRPANLQDHTFRAPIGYVYFDVFNQHYLQAPTLRSARFPALAGDDAIKMRCLSFWFSAFGRGDNSVLSVYSMRFEEGEAAASPSDTAANADPSPGGNEEKPASDGRLLLWSIQSRYLETRRNLWYYAQTAVNAESEYQIIFQGEATDGGFAIDDITFYNGTCNTRPMEAMVKTKTEDSS